jgi:hypothetical protein
MIGISLLRISRNTPPKQALIVPKAIQITQGISAESAFSMPTTV